MYWQRWLRASAPVFLLLLPLAAHAQVDVGEQLAKLRAVGPKGQGNRAATAAWKTLARADAAQLSEVLAGMDGAGVLATNWIRAAVETIAERTLASGNELPTKSLEVFLLDTKHSARGRRLAYELLERVDKTARTRLIPGLRNDPSLELRRDAIAMAISDAAKLLETDKKAAASAFREALISARDVDQINSIAKQIKELGGKPDLPAHFGFLMRWNLIGPFDNRDKKGFAIAYGPEAEFRADASYEGLKDQVRWFSHTTTDELGVVDLNKAIGKHMGAVCYAYTEFHADKAGDIELRLGCINANKVWLNGKQLTANEVYHANTFVDQYVGKGKLKKGKNTILLKICQNEQTENWAQRWQFQLRVCDELGTAVHSLDRPAPRAAAAVRRVR
ncbi:MAG: hypothetical protein QGG36_32675 [Pirellulaceae bacterium]|jgi:hypothetical protein|nr:hypothetical protein [Pirellulaceae bacterium]MDP7020601.1 hypothetical protein [Pirellulaceae bacterium]